MYTDLHCHLLWGIDDGPEDPAATLSMARALSALGFGAVAPSTHAQPQFPGRADVATRREEVRALLAEQGIALSLFEGAENMLDEQFLERELSDRGWHINGGPWLLVEVPFEAIVPTLAELVFRLRRKGSRPLFAHPERCAHFEGKGRAEEVVRTGAGLQLDLGSLIGRYGRPARKLARKFLEAGLYTVAATDLHGPDGAQKWVSEAMRELSHAVGNTELERLMDANPARIVRGEALDDAPRDT
jgi:protein-tyrosine phosphatase